MPSSSFWLRVAVCGSLLSLPVLAQIGCAQGGGSSDVGDAGEGTGVFDGAGGAGEFASVGVSSGGIIALQIAVGRAHSCGGNGQMFCWGAGDRGQLGDGVSGEGYGHPHATLIKDITDFGA